MANDNPFVCDFLAGHLNVKGPGMLPTYGSTVRVLTKSDADIIGTWIARAFEAGKKAKQREIMEALGLTVIR